MISGTTKKFARTALIMLVALTLAACVASIQPAAPPAATSTSIPATITASATAGPSLTPTVSATAPPTSTPDPYQGLTIADLAAREYGAGSLEVTQWNPAGGPFRRAFFEYPSDGLRIHGFMNVPAGPGPFPIVIVLHGYVNPSEYDTLAYTTRYADRLAQEGFFVLHPNYRNYPPSEIGSNPFRIGYAIDVLNLIAIVRQTAGAAGPLEAAEPGTLGLFGHSMGGGIAIRVMAVEPTVDAVVLYGSMSGDEQRNFERILEWSGGRSGWEELQTPADDLRRISPVYHLDRVEAAVSIHHGEADSVVPPAWSQELCQRLEDIEHPVECFQYEKQPHTFYGEGEEQLLERAVEFLRSELD